MIDKKLLEDTIEAQSKRLERMKSRKENYKIEVRGKEFIVLPRVFYPGTDSILMIETVKFDPEDTVLDSCAGTGMFSVFAANEAKKVVAVDVNKAAVENVKENAKLHKLDDKITAMAGDLFPDFEIKFDKISINPPYSGFSFKIIGKAGEGERNYRIYEIDREGSQK